VSVIAVTGGAGKVAAMIRPHLAAAGHEVRLLDLVAPAGPLAPTESAAVVGVTDLEALTEALRGADIVVHLAAYAYERSWEDIRDVNVEGAHAVHEAAVRAGVRRVLAASSVHAAGYLPWDSAAEHAVPAARPDTFYGLSKVVLEAMGSLYADRAGQLVVSARIMTAVERPFDARSLGTWLSAGDAARLVEAALTTTATGHHVVWGVSRNTRRPVSLAAGEAVGYHPVDDAEAYADEVDEPPVGGSTPIGGSFVDHPLGEPM